MREEIDLAFGRVADLGREVPAELEHRLVHLEPPLAEHPLAENDVLELSDLAKEGIWIPQLAARSNGFLICNAYAKNSASRSTIQASATTSGTHWNKPVTGSDG